MSITQLENLSNEIFYEIFEYLDVCFIYNIFSNLNTRFEYLLKYSSLPIKLNLSWTSKSTFEHYCKYIITPNLTRIISLNIPNPLAIKYFLASFPINISFNRLESLNFGRINSDHIISILTCLKSLPRLFSLSISINNPSNNINTIYQLITALPLLKYCKISTENDEPIFSIPIFPRNNEQKESRIEHLIINGVCRLDQLDSILSYTPRLTHLSCHSLQTNNDQISEPTNVINLKKLYLDLGSISFNYFKLFICKVCSQLEILRISANFQKTYLDANQWQQLISYHMPHLRIFDFQFKSELCDNHEKSIEYHILIEQFNSKFWFERNWFFTYQNCRGNYGFFKFFYSIHPYRRKYYKLYEHTIDNLGISPYQDKSIHMCRHVLIENQWMNTDCSIRFPYATKLTLTGGYAAEIPSWISNLSSIISLTQITELILDYDYLFMNKFLMLLQYMPNIDSLTIPQSAIIQTHNLSANEIETISLLSKRNCIRKVIIMHKECTLKQLRFLFDLCRQIEYLSINLQENYEKLIIEFLISKMKENNSCFFALSLARLNSNNDIITNIQSIMNREKLLDNYSLDIFKGNVYLWC